MKRVDWTDGGRACHRVEATKSAEGYAGGGEIVECVAVCFELLWLDAAMKEGWIAEDMAICALPPSVNHSTWRVG